uniref:Uncharacterized protein n=1 Tax=Mola mola TaxID=94237 RepID=A0A3Q3XB99_MOLML
MGKKSVGITTDSQRFRRQEATWELFTSECVYFLDQLMVLKEVIVCTMLQNAQINQQTIPRPVTLDNGWFLLQVSFGFLNNLLCVIKDTFEITDGDGPTLQELLSKAFQGSICHCLQKYCLNYSAALLYLEHLKPREDFGIYWPDCRAVTSTLQLRDLLVAPLQRLTRYPLLLRNMVKRSLMEEETRGLQVIAEQVDTSICDLEGKVKWLDNYQKVKQLRDALVWLPVWERDKRAFVPENLKHLLKAVTLENLISQRGLLHEGKLVLTGADITATRLTSSALQQNLELDQLLKEGCIFTIVDQPVSLDRLQLKNIDQLNASTSGLPHSFIIMHQNRYQQCIGAFILQAASEFAKKVWMSKIEDAVTTLLKLDSERPRIKSSSLWLESSQI